MSKALNRGLGRGLDSLIPSDIEVSQLSQREAKQRIAAIATDQLHANPDQPRRHFDENELTSLAESIKEHGILQPLLVRQLSNGSFQIVAGERRWRAATSIGLAEVPVIVISVDEIKRAEIALIENVQREDLQPLELAAALHRLHYDFNLDYELIGKRIGKAATTVVNIVRLMQLPEAAKEALAEGKITEGHSRAILALRDSPEKQAELLDYILRQDWSVRKSEAFVVAYKQGASTKTQALRKTKVTTPQTLKLSKRLGRDVSVQRMAKGGRLQISYKNDEDLKALTEKLLGSEQEG